MGLVVSYSNRHTSRAFVGAFALHKQCELLRTIRSASVRILGWTNHERVCVSVTRTNRVAHV